LPEPKDPAKEAINHGPPGSPILSLFDPHPEPFCPCACLDECQNPSGIAARFGWWGVERHGSPSVIGEWQSTDSSPFWDIDGLYTNGTRTLNYTATGTDNESTKATVQYYGPKSQGFLDFTRFIHAEEHVGFDNMNASALVPGAGPGSGQPVIAQDLTKGQDFAIRVNQYEMKYKYNLVGQPNKDSSWVTAGINIWDQQEFGDRQASGTTHCFTAKLSVTPGQQASCHLVSQVQSIDWNTFEVTPVLEAQFGRINIQYSHTLRTFSAHDETVLATYTDGGANILGAATAPYSQFPYDVVPGSTTNIDKVRIGIDVNDHNHVYAYGYFSEIENSEAGVSRELGGADVRWTNTDIKGLNLTTYFKNYNQSGNRPTAFTSPDFTQGLTAKQVAAELGGLRDPYGFNRYTAGEKFSWRPWTADCASLLSRLCFTGGYEFDYLIRTNENFYNPSLSALPPAYYATATSPILYQPNTTTNSLYVGVQVPWTDSIHAYANYKLKFIRDALVGITLDSGAVNSNLPDLENIFEFGADWFPSTCFGASFNQSFDISSREGGPQAVSGFPPTIVANSAGDVLNFGEQSYSTTLVTWYKPVDKLILTANADYFTNWIKQNIIIGDDGFGSSTGAGSSFVSYSPYTSPWNYGGTAVEFGGGVSYKLNRDLRFTADYEITFGKDVITSGGLVYSAGSPVVNTFIPLGGYSPVRNVMQQAKVGLDWRPRERMIVFVAYQFIDFEDRSDSANSGSMNMFMGGMTYKW